MDIGKEHALTEVRFRGHPHAEVILSLPGMGKQMGATFIVATGGGMDAFGSSDRLVGHGGLAPAPLDSGFVSDNLRGPRRFHSGLLNAMHMSDLALWAMMRDGAYCQAAPPVTAVA
ncbi:transposase [Streptomyces sp. NPDC017546]|uniref:transposase n=1 Tax=Streptomyces sp. NPDC017546 TaxID=3365001 RepID=UPI003795AE18